jgi:hypothetical protein
MPTNQLLIGTVSMRVRCPMCGQQSLYYKHHSHLHGFMLGTDMVLLYSDVARLMGTGGEYLQWAPPTNIIDLKYHNHLLTLFLFGTTVKKFLTQRIQYFIKYIHFATHFVAP